MERQQPNVFRMKLLGAEVIPALSGSRTLKDALNEALRDWVANVARHVLLHRHRRRPASLSRDGARLPIGDRQRDAAADARARRPAAGLAGGGDRRRLERHGPVPSVPRRDRHRDLRRRGGRARARRAASTRPRSPAGGQACCTATAPTCCRTTTARSTRRIRSRPASTIRASAPSMPGSTTCGRVKYVSATDEEALAGLPAVLPPRRHHPGARAGARPRPGHQARAQQAQGPPHGDEHVRARRQGHLHGGATISG